MSKMFYSTIRSSNRFPKSYFVICYNEFTYVPGEIFRGSVNYTLRVKLLADEFVMFHYLMAS